MVVFMKKNLKLIIGIIIGIIVIFGIIFLIDYNRCSNLKEPIFVVPIKENDLTLKNTVYQGLGYRVEVKKNLFGTITIAIKEYKNKQKITYSFDTNILQSFNGTKGSKNKLN